MRFLHATSAPAALLLCVSAGMGFPDARPAAQVAEVPQWMSGTWLSRKGDTWIEERWAPPRAGVMLGTSLSGSGGEAASYEYMRIAPSADGLITFWGSPGGAPPVPFPMVSGSAQEAVFENPKHDFPTRIVYRREGEALVATISGPGGSNAQSWKYARIGP